MRQQQLKYFIVCYVFVSTFLKLFHLYERALTERRSSTRQLMITHCPDSRLGESAWVFQITPPPPPKSKRFFPVSLQKKASKSSHLLSNGPISDWAVIVGLRNANKNFISCFFQNPRIFHKVTFWGNIGHRQPDRHQDKQVNTQTLAQTYILLVGDNDVLVYWFNLSTQSTSGDHGLEPQSC